MQWKHDRITADVLHGLSLPRRLILLRYDHASLQRQGHLGAACDLCPTP
jgi:hypothetical protein